MELFTQVITSLNSFSPVLKPFLIPPPEKHEIIPVRYFAEGEAGDKALRRAHDKDIAHVLFMRLPPRQVLIEPAGNDRIRVMGVQHDMLGIRIKRNIKVI